MELGQNIKNRRIELGLSQSELAFKVGYKDKGSISRIESGAIDLTQSQIERFGKALECTPAFLMGWEDNISKDELLEALDKAKEIISKSANYKMSNNEKNLIESFRKLDERGKKHIINELENELRYLRVSAYAKGIRGNYGEE